MGWEINYDILPPGGWYIVSKDDGVRHEAGNLKQLAQKMRDFRMRVGRPVGDPVQEIIDYTCERYPTMCKSGIRRVPKPVVAAPPLGAAVVQWLTKIYRALTRSPDALVSKNEADRRAAICVRCKAQQGWISSCGSCNTSVKQLGMQIRKGQEAKNGGVLRACSILREDTRTSVWLDRLQPVQDPNLPPECWRKAR